MTFIDLCAGIGGFRLGFERAGMTCIGFCEIDKFARLSCKAIHNTDGEWESDDITKVSDEEFRRLRGADLICGGFPCQSFSIAGKRKGFEDARGTIIFHFCRALRQIQPRWFVFENVKGILSNDDGRTFRTILEALTELGYCVEWKVLNSKDFGVPQNRERVFIIGHFGDGRGRKVFSVSGDIEENPAKLQELTKGVKDAYRVYDCGGLSRTLKSEGGGMGAKTGLYSVPVLCTIHKPSGTHGGESAFNLRNVGCDTAACLASRYYKGLSADGCNGVICGFRIRKLTPRECWRLQGFPDECFDKAHAAGLSDTQLYRQAGNAVTVNVAEWIGKMIVEADTGF